MCGHEKMMSGPEISLEKRTPPCAVMMAVLLHVKFVVWKRKKMKKTKQ